MRAFVLKPIENSENLKDKVYRQLRSVISDMDIYSGDAPPKLDERGLAEYIVEYAGLPAKVVRSDEEVAAIKEQREEQQQQMMQQQQEMMAAEKAQKAAPMLKVMNDAATENPEDVPAA